MNYYRIAQKKYQKAVRISKLLRYIPGVEMIAVCNSLSYNRAQPGSDVDLFIIARRGYIWTVRGLILAALAILRCRPNVVGSKKNTDAVCVSFILGSQNLNLMPYKICVQDVYLNFWIKKIKPLYTEKELYKKFIQSNNIQLPALYQANYRRRVKMPLVKKIGNILPLNLGEPFFKKIQLLLLPKKVKYYACAFDSRVLVADSILKFHLNDRRLYFRDRILERS